MIPLETLSFGYKTVLSMATVGFSIGVIVSTLFYVHLTGLRVRATRRTVWRDCDERYD